MTFNAVGLGGIAVQLSVLGFLVHAGGVPDLLATALAVECAILNNFVWHQRWTWHDRPSRGRETLRRLARFHILNGLISLAGNIGVTMFCVRVLGSGVMIANTSAIVLCSLVNFGAGDALVFAAAARRSRVVARMGRRSAQIAGAVLAVVFVAPSASAGPASATLAAWRSYELQLDTQYGQAASAPAGAFFAFDRGLARDWRAAVLRGEQVAVKVEAPSIPDGKIHHWIGAIFIPNLTIDALVSRLEARAGRESETYEDVLASHLIDRDGDRVRVFMKLRRTNLITVTYNTEHSVEYRRLSPARATARSAATKIAELADANTAQEREKGPADDNGFLWRLNAYWRYEAAEGGVIVECESVSLSRPVPLLVRPVANPIVTASRASRWNEHSAACARL
jgi:putative flippase GtrA